MNADISKPAGATVEETGLSLKTTTSTELATTTRAMEAQTEIQGAIMVAQRFPRNEDEAFEKLMRASKRQGFAESARYSFPRGGGNVSGPSVNMAREAARVWGNIRHGLEILRDDADERHIRGWAWDVQTNTKVTAEDSFAKLIQRKPKGGGPAVWVVPDERDLRELTNRRGAILVRNCILQILPVDLIDDAMAQCVATKRDRAAKDPDGERKKMIEAFSSLNISPSMLEQYLGHPVGQSSPDEISTLREMFQSIRDSNSKWSEYVIETKAKKVDSEISMDNLVPDTDANGRKAMPREAKPKKVAKSKPLSKAKVKAIEKRITASEKFPGDIYYAIKEVFGVQLAEVDADQEEKLEALLETLFEAEGI